MTTEQTGQQHCAIPVLENLEKERGDCFDRIKEIDNLIEQI